MALKDCGRIFIGDPIIMTAMVNGYTSSVQSQINAAGQKHAWGFRVPKSGTINKLGLRFSAVANAQTCRISLQTSSSGFPSGTFYGSSNYQTLTPSVGFIETTLATPATATVGDIIWMVLEFDSTGGDVTVSFVSPWGTINYPKTAKYNAGWGNNTTDYGLPDASIGYNDGTYPRCGLFPNSTNWTAVSINNGSSPNEYGLVFTPQVPCRLVGAYYDMRVDASADHSVNLYTTPHTLITSAQQNIIDSRWNGSGGTNINEIYFPSPTVLTKGTQYYLSVLPTTVNAIRAGYITLPVAAMSEAYGYGPQSTWACSLATYNGSTLTTTTTQVSGIIPILDQFDDGVGGGGGSIFIVEG